MTTTTQKILAGAIGISMVLSSVAGVAVSFANAQVADAMTATYTRNLTVGSTGADVSALQQTLYAAGYLKVAPTGYFGSLTKAAVKAWQAAVGLPSTGYFGALSRAAIGGTSTGGTSTVPGCSAGALFSSTTGQPCTSGSSVPGCSAGAMYSSTTGQPCTGGTTTGGTVGGTLDNTDGSVTVSSSPFVSSGQQLKKGDTKDVLAVRLQATSGKVAVNRFDVHFNLRPWLYFNKVTLHDNNGNVVATKTISGASDATEVTVGSDYLVRFEGVNYVVTPGSDATLVVSASVLPATDKLTTNTAVTVSVPSGAVRTLNGRGYTDSSQPSATISNSITLLSSGSVADLFTRISPSSPLQRLQQTSTSQTTTNVILGVFSIKAQNNSATINSMSFNVQNSTGAATSSILSNVRLVNGSQVYGAANLVAAGGATFTNLNIALPQDQWTDLTLEADIPQNVTNVSASTTLLATSINAVDANYNTATLSNASNVTSSDVTFSTASVTLSNLSHGAVTSVTQNNVTTKETSTLTFTVTNTGNQDVYISKTPAVTLSTSTTGTTGTTTSPRAWNVTASPDTNAGDISTAYDVPSGTSRTFTYSVDLFGSQGNSYTFNVTAINFATTTSATGQSIGFGLTPLQIPASF